MGGFGAIILSNKGVGPFYTSTFGGATHMETGRAELTAMLAGLHAILDVNGWMGTGVMKQLAARKDNVLIVTDREDLVGSINRIYKRGEAHGDLWAQFEWYERYFYIEAVHAHRETVELHKAADRIASEMRIVIKEMDTVQRECGHL